MRNGREVDKKGKVGKVGETLCVLGIAATIVNVLLGIIMTII